MFPNEAQEMMAKILFVVFAMIILTVSKVSACEAQVYHAPSKNIFISQ